ncbi:MAG: carbohydrate kinase, partial [Clostridiales bacterium]|nr:carbohydrate kinase [Clostridiales bacterium]
GLDIGTTGCKLTVFDAHGDYLGKAYRDYPVRRAVSGHETDISTMMESVYAVIQEMAAQYPDIAGIGVTSFGETFIMTNEAGEPLHNAMLYTDPRGAEECAELVQKLGADHIAEVTGLAPHEMYSIAKMMWIKKHQPQVYAAAKRIHLIEDFVVWHLTGKAQIDYSLATRTMAFDIHALTWSREVFDAAGIDVRLMSAPVPTGTSAGTITAATAQRTGLNGDCIIVSVAHDQVAAAVGAGAFDGSVAVDGAGTVECLTPIYDSIPEIAVMAKGFFSVVPHAVPGKYAAYAFSYTGGALIQWAMETFGRGETNESMEQAYGKDEPSGLLVLPHFAGAATPYMDTGSKGAILGLTTATTAADIYRACMEGVAYEMRLNYEALAGSGIRFERLNATGGGAKSKIWMQMKADVLDLPITSLKTVDAGTVGSAMLTGIAVGLFRDLDDAASHMVEERETYEPRKEMHEKYMKIYERYKAVYQAVRPLM